MKRNTSLCLLLAALPIGPICNGSTNIGPFLKFSHAEPTTQSTEQTVLLEEHFDMFTAGSETAPATEIEMTDNNNIVNPDYTLQPDWTGRYVYQAGGTCYVGGGSSEKGAYLNTPTAGYYGINGSVSVKFRARLTQAASSDVLYVDDRCAPSGDNTIYIDLSHEWKDYEAMLYGDWTTTFFQFGTNENSPFLIDDIEITPNRYRAPVALPPNDYDGTSFTAEWELVEDATAYYLDVYTVGNDGEVAAYLVKDRRIDNATQSKVTGLDPQTHYLFKVAAEIDGKRTPQSKSEVVELGRLQRPILKEASAISKEGFTGSWLPVFGADGYFTQLCLEYTAAQETDYDYLNTDFSEVNSDRDLDGETLDRYLDRTGWMVSVGMAEASGRIGLDNTNSYATGPAFMVSPKMDFSHNGGVVDVDLTLSGDRQMRVFVGMYKAKGDSYELIGEAVPIDISTQPEEFHLAVSGGIENSYLIIRPATLINGITWIDDLRVAQKLQKGESAVVFVRGGTRVNDGETHTFSTPETKPGERYGYCVTAYHRKATGIYIYSEASEQQFVDPKASVATVATLQNASIRKDGNLIRIANPKAQTAIVVTINGVVLYSGNDAEITLPMLSQGIYVVRIGEETIKVVI